MKINKARRQKRFAYYGTHQFINTQAGANQGKKRREEKQSLRNENENEKRRKLTAFNYQIEFNSICLR